MRIIVYDKEQLRTVCAWWYKKELLPYNKFRIRITEGMPLNYWELCNLLKRKYGYAYFPAIISTGKSLWVHHFSPPENNYGVDESVGAITYDDWEASGREYIRE